MGDCELIVTGGPGLGTVRALVGDGATLGSAPGCELLFDAPGIAPYHVEFRRVPGGTWSLRALAPVLLDGQPVESAEFRTGSFLLVGETEFCLREAGQTGPSGTLATPRPFAGGGRAASLRETAPARPHNAGTSPGALQPGQLVDGRYALGERIASGGMGEVFHARHVELDRPVALKVMKAELSDDPDFSRRFKREAMAAGRIGQRNIVDVFDLGRTEDGRFYFAMEYVDGVTLAALLRRQGALPVGRTLKLLTQVARALVAAHSEGIVHRDLKPDNVMVLQRPGEPDFVKVLDFGVAKVSRGGASGMETAVGSVVGTPQYMSPEQAQGLPADARSDVYALGLLAHELLRGRPTFEAQTASMLIVKQVTEAPERFVEPIASSIPPALDALVFRMLAKEPGSRPQSMSEVLTTLEHAEVTVERPGGPARRALAPRGLVPGLAVALAGIAAALWVRPVEQRPTAAQAAPALPVPSPSPSADPVHITFATDPPSRVREGDLLLGTTPLRLSRPRGTTLALGFESAGYRAQEMKVRFESDQEIEVRLEPAPGPAPAKPARGTRALKASPY